MTEQEKLDRVTLGIWHEMENRGKCGHFCSEGRETVSCAYDKDGLCIQHWGNDALSLLKRLEPIAVQPYTEAELDGYKPRVKVGDCPSCGKILNQSMNFCAKCGQAVKWE